MPLNLDEVKKITRFGLAGLPGLISAFGLNILLIEIFRWPKPVAYLLVVWMQMTLGFIMCRWVVFTGDLQKPVLAAYAQFALSMAVIRVMDWTFYSTLVEIVRVPYLIAQASSTALFFGIKFLSARAVFEMKTRRERAEVPHTN